MVKKTPTGSPGSSLAQIRWNKATSEEREQVGRELAEARWGNATDAERAAVGRKLADARKKKRAARAKKKPATKKAGA